MSVMTAQDAVKRVSGLTGLLPCELHATRWPDCDAWCVAQPIRGGIRVVVGGDGTVLFAGSALDVWTVRHAFREGRRDRPVTFLRAPEPEPRRAAPLTQTAVEARYLRASGVSPWSGNTGSREVSLPTALSSDRRGASDWSS